MIYACLVSPSTPLIPLLLHSPHFLSNTLPNPPHASCVYESHPSPSQSSPPSQPQSSLLRHYYQRLKWRELISNCAARSPTRRQAWPAPAGGGGGKEPLHITGRPDPTPSPSLLALLLVSSSSLKNAGAAIVSSRNAPTKPTTPCRSANLKSAESRIRHYLHQKSAREI